jgi:hypothetical protein
MAWPEERCHDCPAHDRRKDHDAEQRDGAPERILQHLGPNYGYVRPDLVPEPVELPDPLPQARQFRGHHRFLESLDGLCRGPVERGPGCTIYRPFEDRHVDRDRAGGLVG